MVVECHPYVCKFLAKIISANNPNLVDYVKGMEIIPILTSAICNATHELAIFESTLALVQLSGLGAKQVSLILAQPAIINTLIQNLMEENQFVVQATLELINNLSFNPKLQKYFQEVRPFIPVSPLNRLAGMLREHPLALCVVHAIPRRTRGHGEGEDIGGSRELQ